LLLGIGNVNIFFCAAAAGLRLFNISVTVRRPTWVRRFPVLTMAHCCIRDQHAGVISTPSLRKFLQQ
jgi:hypothetical protein